MVICLPPNVGKNESINYLIIQTWNLINDFSFSKQ
jgi:hypothetical protein